MCLHIYFMDFSPAKIPYLIMEIARKLNKTESEAFDIFYESETYKLLCDKQTYYWSESSQYVAESFMREFRGASLEEFA